MSTVLPPAPPPLPSSTAGGAGPVSVAVVSGTVDLLDGALVEAIALARATKGVIVAQTAGGPLELKAGLPLPPIPEGARLLLQVQGKGDEAQLRLLAINGRPLGGVMPPPGLASPGLPALAGLIGDALPPPAGDVALAPGMSPGQPLGLTATIIRPAVMPGASPFPAAPPPAGASFGGLPPDLPPGTQVTVRIAEVGVPAAGTPVPPGAAPAPAGSAPALPGAVPPPAAPVQVAVPAPVPAPPSAQPAPLLPGTVTAQSPGGQAVVQTPVGTLTMPTHRDLPAGTPLMLEVVGKPQPPAPPPAPPASALQGLTAQGWPALTQAVEVLRAASQAQAAEELLRVVPQAGPHLAASLAAFAGALKTGDTRRLIPDSAVRGLDKAGKKDMAERLKADLEALREDSGRPVGGGEWRGFTMPFLNGGAVEPVRLFVRGAGEDGGGGRRGGGNGNDQRFILDLSLTRLGRVQMDGLVRREDKLFDLIIRTDAPLSPDMRRDILGIFTNASELVGTKGGVSFQAGGRWIELPPLPPEPTRIEA